MSATDPIISVSGLRGIVGESLTPEIAARYAAAFAGQAPDGPIVLTRDGRHSGPMLTDVIRGALVAMGRDVVDAGIAATPTCGILVRQFKAAGGIQISASHNPPPYNGMKLFAATGRVLDAATGEKVLTAYRAGQPAWHDHTHLGKVQPCEDAHAEHLRRVLATVNTDLIRHREFCVLLDSNHGSGSLLGRHLLAELGCHITLLGDVPDGAFAHPPEPTAENLDGVRTQVTDCGAAVGFCQDPDADRLALIDETGRYIGEEYTLALCLDHVLTRRRGTIVVNCATSRMSEDVAVRHGSVPLRSKVGEANVCDLMIREKAVFGGEGSGGPIDPQVGYVRDSFVGMALILEGLAVRGESMSQWADSLPRYEIVKTKFTLSPEKIPAALKAVESHFSDAKADHQDGLRLDWPDRWLLVRASNTEPIVRAIAEAPTAEGAQGLCDEAGKMIRAG